MDTANRTPYARVFFRGLVLAGLASAAAGLVTAGPLTMLVAFCAGFCLGIPAMAAALALHTLTSRCRPVWRATAAGLGGALGTLLLPAALEGPAFAVGLWPYQWAPLLAATAAVLLTGPLRQPTSGSVPASGA